MTRRSITIKITTPDDDGDWEVQYSTSHNNGSSTEFSNELGELMPTSRHIKELLEWEDES